MSTYNIREKFSFVMTTSSIDYVRNYNFNTSTVTDIPLVMSNSDEQIPITVYIKTSMPWIEVIDPATGASVINPIGNVVIPPSSSTTVLVKVDLPPDIESKKINNLKENIFLEIKSGSFKIEQTEQITGSLKNKIIVENDIYYLNVGETVSANITVYDVTGAQDLTAQVVWQSENRNIAQVENTNNTEIDYNPYTPRTIRALSPGETIINISAGEDRTAKITVKVRGTVDESTGGTTTVTNQGSSDNTNQQRNSTDTNPQRMVVE